MRSSKRIAVGVLAVALAVVAPAGIDAPAQAKTYANCKALNADYPHGVGQSGAVDSTSGTPVTDFTVDNALYRDNSKSDRDGDGIACEKH